MSLGPLSDLVRRVDHVYKECGGAGDKVQDDGIDDSKLDEFTKLKKQIARRLKEIRANIKERDEMLAKQGNTKATIELGQGINRGLQDVNTDAKKLSALQKTQARKKGGKGQQEDQISNRAEAVDLIFQHIHEVEAFNRRRFDKNPEQERAGRGGRAGGSIFGGSGDKGKEDGSNSARGGNGGGAAAGARAPAGGRANNRNELLGGRAGGGGGRGSGPSDPMETELPEIDITEGLAQLKKKDQEIDSALDRVSAIVGNLNQQARSIGDELTVQGAIIDDIHVKTDKAQIQLYGLNKKLQKTLEQVRGPERFCLDIILLCVVLGIGGFIYKMIG